jgi:hypothetical protein
LIATLLITIFVEGLVVIGYSLWRKKPIKPVLFTSICGNLITQSFLWIGLNLFFRNYLVTLLGAEILIWVIESGFLYSIPANHLDLKEAILLSLGMNATSFAIGWFLPV